MFYKKLLILSCMALISSSDAQLCSIKEYIPTIIIDMRYATPDNITQRPIYTRNNNCCYAHESVINALTIAQEMLLKWGYSLKIWDSYQPLSALHTIYNLIPDQKYISDPNLGDAHTRGMAVDVTLVNLQTGSDVEMPTKFDCITEDSFCDCIEVSDQAHYHRALLRDCMLECGFIQPLKTPWWHFEMSGWQEMPMLDVDFERLARSINQKDQ